MYAFYICMYLGGITYVCYICMYSILYFTEQLKFGGYCSLAYYLLQIFLQYD